MNRNGNRRRPFRDRNKAGFTLIEVMVSLVLLALGMLASIIGIMSALNHGMINDMRNQAIAVALQQAEQVANTPFTNIGSLPQTQTQVTTQVRNGPVSYTVTPTYTPYPNAASPTLYQVNIVVSWSAKENIFNQYTLPEHNKTPFTFTLNTIVGQ